VVKNTADNYLLLCFCTKAAGFITYFIAVGDTYSPNDFSVIFLLFFVFKPKGFGIFFRCFREYVHFTDIFITVCYEQVQNLDDCIVRLDTLLELAY
jgi:hypothetical protein